MEEPVVVDFSDSPYAKATVGLSVVVILAFALLVVGYVKKHQGSITNEEFVTARKSSGKWSIAFSFYASAMGSWVISGPADYAFWAGLIGCIMYAFAAAIPIVAIGFFGNKIQAAYPDVLSLSDYIHFRFGNWTQGMVVFITLFNMAVAASAEYTTIASLFSEYVALYDNAVFIVILLGVTTLSYTALGGLRVSILTDKAQAVVSILLFLVIMIFITSTYRTEGGLFTPDVVGDELNEQLLGKSETGYSSLFTMPLSLLTATVFSEAMYQRVWASENESTVRFGSIVAAFMVFFGRFRHWIYWNFGSLWRQHFLRHQSKFKTVSCFIG